MRLLHTESITLTEFIGSAVVPPYAILSHTWEDDEVLFADFEDGAAPAKRKRAFAKVQRCCGLAREQGYDYVWIDTCCIDKSSSAELSEAINSMFRWYKFSAVCYVFFQDVTGVREGKKEEDDEEDDEEEEGETRVDAQKIEAKDSPQHKTQLHHVSDFPKSRWFKRGWTLQELLAPQNVEFYTREWHIMGTKSNLVDFLEQGTRIPKAVLLGGDLFSCSVAERMSWAAGRQTTREEDQAYSLMGLFNVNMPLIYGEGRSAFRRLQLEIFTIDEDYSLFAWTAPLTSGDCLATSPADFFCHFETKEPGTLGERDRPALNLVTEEADVVELVEPSSGQLPDLHRIVHACYQEKQMRRLRYDEAIEDSRVISRQPPAITSRGLRVNVFLKRGTDERDHNLVWIHLEVDQQLLCIRLKKTSTRYGAVYERFKAHRLYSVQGSLLHHFSMEEIYLRWHTPQNYGTSPGLDLNMVSNGNGSSATGTLEINLRDTPQYHLSLRGTLSGYPFHHQELNLPPGETRPINFNATRGLRNITMVTCTPSEGSKRPPALLFVAYGAEEAGRLRPWCHVAVEGGNAPPRSTRRRLVDYQDQNFRFPFTLATEGALCQRSAARGEHYLDVVFTAVVRHLEDTEEGGEEGGGPRTEMTVQVESVGEVEEPWLELLLRVDEMRLKEVEMRLEKGKP